MKKRILIATAMMLVLSVGVAMGVKKANMNQNPWADNIEALCSSEDPRCISGGPGATSCSIDAGVAGVGVGCSVGCGRGYACCGAMGCICV